MIRAPLLALLLLAALALPAPARDHGRDHDDIADDWAPDFDDPAQQDLRILPLKRAAEIVQDRFRGRLIAARIVPPTGCKANSLARPRLTTLPSSTSACPACRGSRC